MKKYNKQHWFILVKYEYERNIVLRVERIIYIIEAVIGLHIELLCLMNDKYQS